MNATLHSCADVSVNRVMRSLTTGGTWIWSLRISLVLAAVIVLASLMLFLTEIA